jgi:LemA protein
MDLITWAIILLIVLIVVIILLVFWGIYNRIIRTENQIDNAWAQIDVQMKRRADLIPNLMETVRGYMKHERGTMEAVTNARAAIMSAKTPQQSNDANNMLTGALKTLFAVAESYPDLKANQN